MKSNHLANRPVLETEPDGAEADRPIWFLGRELESRPTEDAFLTPPPRVARSGRMTEAAPRLRFESDEDEPEERRPSQLEAYMRYAKMREPRDDDMLTPSDNRANSRGGYALAYENDIDWHDDAPPRRHPRRRRASRGLRLREAFFAGIASIAVGAVGGTVVYDRANNGE